LRACLTRVRLCVSSDGRARALELALRSTKCIIQSHLRHIPLPSPCPLKSQRYSSAKALEKAIFPSSSPFGHWDHVKGFFTSIDAQTMSKRYHEIQQILLRVLSHAWENAMVQNFFGADGLAAIYESAARVKAKRALAMSLQDQTEEDETAHSEGTAERHSAQQAMEVAAWKVQVALAAEMARMAQPQASHLAKANAEQAARERVARETEARERAMREAEALAKAAREAEAVENAARAAEAEAEKRAAMAREEEEVEGARVAKATRVAEAEADRLAKVQAEQETPAYTVYRLGRPGSAYAPWTEYPFQLKSKDCQDCSRSFRVVSKLLVLLFVYFPGMHVRIWRK